MRKSTAICDLSLARDRGAGNPRISSSVSSVPSGWNGIMIFAHEDILNQHLDLCNVAILSELEHQNLSPVGYPPGN